MSVSVCACAGGRERKVERAKERKKRACLFTCSYFVNVCARMSVCVCASVRRREGRKRDRKKERPKRVVVNEENT